ncbi:MAG TPA: carbon-nitrogen family hydrolase [Nitriliruptorales bacterium]
MVTVAAIQHDIWWEQPAMNFERLAPRIAAAAGSGARLVVLTEMFSTGFSMHTDATAEPLDGPSTTFLIEQAARTGAWVGGTLPALHDGFDRPHNTFTLAGPDGQVHRYSKIHPFTYSGEHEHFASGQELLTVDVGSLRVTMFVCYDLRFADEFWTTALNTDVYLIPANWPESRRTHWQALLRARAIENQAYVVGCNRVGTGGKLSYVGDSAIIDPYGRVLAEAAHTESTLYAEVDPLVVRETRERYPFLQDRRHDQLLPSERQP